METSSNEKLRLGNCFFGALYLRYKFKGSKMIAKRIRSQRMRHFIVIDANGNKWHFKRKEHILPEPLSFLLFWGQYEKISKPTPN